MTETKKNLNDDKCDGNVGKMREIMKKKKLKAEVDEFSEKFLGSSNYVKTA